MELEQKITERVELLKRERDRYIVEANQNVAVLNALIGELEQLLKPEPQEVQK